MSKLISFEKLREVCEDKLFDHRGDSFYFVKCKQGIPFCNDRVCPVWNSLEDPPAPNMSLREINMTLKNGKKDDNNTI